MSQQSIASIIVPLYIYPEPSAWNPLFALLNDFPNQPITLIINPNSGPFHPNLPKRYFPAIRQLRQFRQVTLLGYIASKWLAKSADEVVKEIQAYAAWDADVGMDGIFFDESTYSADGIPTYTQYSECVHAQKWPHHENGLVVLNPGCIPHAGYYAISDIIVVLENSYPESVSLKQRLLEHSRLPDPHTGRSNASKMAAMVHSCDSEEEAQEIIRFAKDSKWQGFFVTATDGYTSFGEDFRNSFEYNEALADEE